MFPSTFIPAYAHLILSLPLFLFKIDSESGDELCISLVFQSSNFVTSQSVHYLHTSVPLPFPGVIVCHSVSPKSLSMNALNLFAFFHYRYSTYSANCRAHKCLKLVSIIHRTDYIEKGRVGREMHSAIAVMTVTSTLFLL